jgi:Xaa-Pro dipeptidase
MAGYRNSMSRVEQIERRLASLRAELVSAGLDGAVIVQNTDLAYFTGTNQQAHLIVPAAGDPRLLVRRTLDRAHSESPLRRIEPLRSLSGLAPALADAGLTAGARIGFELDVLRATTYLGYVRRLEGYRVEDASAAIAAVRARKSAEDIAEMRAAAAQIDAATRAVPSLLRVGKTESQVQVEVEGILRTAGHQGLMRYRGFNQELHYGQVLTGASGSVAGYSDSPLCGPGPNPVIGKGAGGQVIAAGEPVIVDLVGAHGGWLADQTRTFFVGSAPPDLRDAYAASVAILRAVEAALRPGAIPAELFALAERMAADAGLGEHFMGVGPSRVRFLGHGLGMEVDETPVLAPGFDRPMVEGNVVAIEPKFVFAERGAVGIENTYAVTAAGFDTLTTAPEELIQV